MEGRATAASCRSRKPAGENKKAFFARTLLGAEHAKISAQIASLEKEYADIINRASVARANRDIFRGNNQPEAASKSNKDIESAMEESKITAAQIDAANSRRLNLEKALGL